LPKGHRLPFITSRKSPEGNRQQDIASSNEKPQRGKEPRVSCTIGRKHAWRQENGKGFIRHDVLPASTSSAQDITKQRTHQKQIQNASTHLACFLLAERSIALYSSPSTKKKRNTESKAIQDHRPGKSCKICII
jgi:hypothetical protein